MDVIIYHNPACATSRNVLAMIRNSGVEPHIIEYLKCPPTRLLLTQLLARAGLTVRQILREKGTPYHELGLGDPSLSDDALLDAIGAHPILMNRPLAILLGIRFARASVPWLVGLYITAAYWFTASTSFANPAVAIARSLTNTFSGIRPLDLPGFIAAQLIGATCGMAFAAWLLRQPESAAEAMNVEAQL